MATVRVSMLADPIEVPDDEVPVLRAQGLLIEPGHEAPESTERAVKAAGAAKPDTRESTA